MRTFKAFRGVSFKRAGHLVSLTCVVRLSLNLGHVGKSEWESRGEKKGARLFRTLLHMKTTTSTFLLEPLRNTFTLLKCKIFEAL